MYRNIYKAGSQLYTGRFDLILPINQVAKNLALRMSWRLPNRTGKTFVAKVFVTGRYFVGCAQSETVIFNFKTESGIDSENQCKGRRMNNERQFRVFTIISVFNRMIIMGL